MKDVHSRVLRYIEKWKDRGYPNDIPDEVPHELAKLGKAPSYKAVCLALLQNDHALTSLGFSPKTSKYYKALKRIELKEREYETPI